MGNWKLVCKFYLIFLLTSLPSYAQLLNPYFGIGFNRQSEFYNGGYYNLSAGLELKKVAIFKPKVGLKYFIGVFQNEIANYDNTGNLSNTFSSTFSNFSIEFVPKIMILKKHEKLYYFQILPIYTFSEIKAIGSFESVISNQTTIKETEIFNNAQHNIGLGLGFVLQFKKEKPDSIEFNLNYYNIDVGYAVNKLTHSNATISTRNVLNFEILYLFSLKK